MGGHRYYMAPKGLLKAEDLPEGWGLLEVAGKKVYKAVAPLNNPDRDHGSEQRLLVSCLRRIGKNSPNGVSVKCYTYQTKNRATLGLRES